MARIVRETIVTKRNNPSRIVRTPVTVEATDSQTIEYLIYYLFGAVEVLLAFRLVLKMMGASLSSGFVSFIYSLSGIFIMPFEGIFRRGFAEGIETTSVIEPSTLVALIVYIILAWGIVKLIRISSGEQQED